jgi:hypothetical protein
MKAVLPCVLLVCALTITSVSTAAENGPSGPSGAQADEWTNDVGNAYFTLQPGHAWVLGGKSEGKIVTLTVTVLAETFKVNGVETRVIEERKLANGQLVEVSRGYFALSKKSEDIHCFGRDVAMYDNGRVTGRRGSWQAGVNGAQSALTVPAKPYVGQSFYTGQGRAVVVSLSAAVQSAAGAFGDCLVMTVETTPPLGKVTRAYAPSVGLVQDGNLLLTHY